MRLDRQPYEIIDRDRVVPFRFEGRDYDAFAGDTYTSALLAANVRTLGRSFKYHRPRSAYSLAGHDANVMLEGDGKTNIRGDLAPVTPGADLRAVNTLGGVDRDWLQYTEMFSRFMPVGFYYKAFHTPRKLFPWYEKQLRNVAGLGRINPRATAEDTPKRYDFCDVLVAGSGAAGLSAALEAADNGAQVIVVDDQRYLGGSLRYGGYDELTDLLDKAKTHDRIDLRPGTQAAGYYGDHWIALIDDEKLTKLRARSVVVATGAFEQPAVFGHNDLPGVMLGSAAQRLVNLYAVKPCKTAVLLAANNDAYRVALTLLDVGVRIAGICDLRDSAESAAAQQVASRGVAIYHGYTIYEAVGDHRRHVEAARIMPIDSDPAKCAMLPCDGIIVSAGWAPNGGLLYQAGAKFGYDSQIEGFRPRTVPEGVYAAGKVGGVFNLEDKLEDGRRAGRAAALGETAEPVRHRGAPPSHPYPIFKHEKKKNFVDFDEDLHLTDFVNACNEGYDNIELIKRYTTVGMGPSQGKLANMNAVRILAKLTGRGIDETGTTTSRPFYQPVAMKHLAGRRFHPHRRTPMHDWHAKRSAVWLLAGPWSRPEYYAKPGRTKDDCVLAEAKRVRDGVGLIDVSTLGKLEISGRDAAAFLERTYTGKFTSQKVGKLRYCLALDETGVVIDDGVAVRWADDRFYVTATTSGAAAMYQQMQRNAILWKMQVTIVNATGRYAAMNIAGPQSRDVLTELTDIDLSADGFPYLAAREGKVAGVDAKLIRVGFVGELGFEVHVPVSRGLHVWEALMEAGAAHGIAPFGVEAQRLLRLEKGHFIVSQDTDALTNPFEAGAKWAIAREKTFQGSRSLDIVEKHQQQRTLVGIRFGENHAGPLPEECHLIIDRGEIAGRVTSIAKQSTLGYPLGMAFVKPDQSKPGTTVHIRTSGGAMVDAEVTALPFYDPQGEKQK